MIIVRLMKIVLIILVFLAAFFPVYINISAFAIEPDEEDSYIVLLDEGQTDIHTDGSYVTRTHVRYKILKDDALHDLGEEEISYFSETEDVDIIKALVIKPNGRKVRAKKIQDLSPYSGFPLYSDLKTKIVSMRNLAVGDILEIEYKITTKHSRIKGEAWGGFYFCSYVPIELSRFILSMPADKEIYIKSENMDIKPRIEYSENGAIKTFTWEMKDCKKIEAECLMPIEQDLYPYLLFSTIDDWQKISTWYWNATKDKITPTPEIIEEVKLITKDAKDTKDRIAKILRYFHDNFRYVSMSFGANAYEPHPAGEVFENKYGDCKDQTILLIAMLKVIGIDAYPVLVRYGNKAYSLDRLVPSPRVFTHAIAYTNIEGQDLWLDPLVEGIALEEIHFSLTEEKLFVIKPDKGEFIDIPPMDIDLQTSIVKTNIVLQDDGSCIGSLESIISHKESPSFRSMIEDFTAKKMDELKRELLNRVAPGGEIIDVFITDPKDYSRSCSFLIKFRSDRWAPVMGDFMILPSLSPDFRNPFTLPESERKYPIYYMEESKKKNVCIVTIPGNFKFEYIPEDYEISTHICKYTLISQLHDNRLVMVSENHWYPGKIPLDQYSKAQDFFNDLQKEADKKIIIKRKKIERK